jgi:CRP/FNR family transcriptional regulator
MPGTRSSCPREAGARAAGRRPDVVEALPLVQALQGTTRSAVVKALRHYTVQKHEQIIQEGAEARALFFVLDGAVMVWKQRSAGDTQVTGFLFPGDLLGTLIGERYLYSARAVVDGKLATVASAELAELAERHPDLRHALYRHVTNDFALAQDQLLVLGAMSAVERVATALLQFERRQQARGVAQGVPVWLPMRRTDLASYLGLELPTLSRAFSRLRQDGVIASPSTTDVAIRDRDALLRLSGDAYP